MHVKKGMDVRIISGNNKGQNGKVLEVFPKKEKVIVEGINLRKRAIRPTQENPSGGFVERESPIHISNVMALHNGEPVRVGYKKLNNGKKVRISNKSKEELSL